MDSTKRHQPRGRLVTILALIVLLVAHRAALPQVDLGKYRAKKDAVVAGAKNVAEQGIERAMGEGMDAAAAFSERLKGFQEQLGRAGFEMDKVLLTVAVPPSAKLEIVQTSKLSGIEQQEVLNSILDQPTKIAVETFFRVFDLHVGENRVERISFDYKLPFVPKIETLFTPPGGAGGGRIGSAIPLLGGFAGNSKLESLLRKIGLYGLAPFALLLLIFQLVQLKKTEKKNLQLAICGLFLANFVLVLGAFLVF